MNGAINLQNSYLKPAKYGTVSPMCFQLRLHCVIL